MLPDVNLKFLFEFLVTVNLLRRLSSSRVVCFEVLLFDGGILGNVGGILTFDVVIEIFKPSPRNPFLNQRQAE